MRDDGGVVVEDEALPVRSLAQGIRVVVKGSHAAVQPALVDHDGILGGVEHVALTPGALPAATVVVVDLRVALAAALGGDEHDAVSSTRTVHGTRGSILQHLDALYVIGVQVVQAALDGHAIDDVERVAVVDGTDAADADARGIARLARVGGDGDTRCEALQRVIHTHGGHHTQVARVHLRDGCRDHTLLLHAVADDHHILQRLGIFLQDDVQHGSGRHALRRVAHERNHDGRTTLHVLQRKTTVHVGDGTVRRTPHGDRGADDRLSRLVIHNTSYRHPLRKGSRWSKKQQQQGRYDPACPFSLCFFHVWIILIKIFSSRR